MAKAAIEPLGLVRLTKRGDLMLPADVDASRIQGAARVAVRAHQQHRRHRLLRRDVPVSRPADAKRKVVGEKGPQAAVNFMDLPNHGILDRGRLIGLWEYDTDSSSIAWTSFVPKSKALTAAVARTEDYVRSQLSDARSFSLDSPKSRVARIAALRKAG